MINVMELVDAGMFYLGEMDKTECFYCGIQLEDLKIHDEPWVEHARLSQDCAFLIAYKGIAFVISCLEFYELPTTGIKTKLPGNQLANGARGTPGPPPQASGASESHQHLVPKRIIRRVEPREIRSRLDMDNAKMLTNLGYPRELVGQVIGERLQTEADDFRHFGDLIRAVMSAAEMLGIQLHTERPRVHLQSFPLSPFERSSMLGSSAASSVEFASQSAGEGLDPAVRSAMEENRSLKQKIFCKRCWKKEVNVVLLNCGHMVLCEDCAKLVHICPTCNNHILQRVKVFVA
ncbi:baculoviral IAP repeat-containing protein 2-like [Lineus longissimus]|uniref:baculoviral IAP repeat-containing protein 2-like n=1 Tax=Lineus longissimus TaxID=88925 RepID=UPI00315C8E2B